MTTPASTPSRPPAVTALPRACLSAVTALQFLDDAHSPPASPLRLLVGAASSLSLFDARTGCMLDRCTALGAVGRRIHGLRVERTQQAHPIVIVWGGKHLSILRIEEPAAGSAGGYFRLLWHSPARNDLILDARLLRCGTTCPHSVSSAPAAAPADTDSFDLAVAYAHDRVEVLSFSFESANDGLHAQGSHASLRCNSTYPQLHCDDRSLLYSARLHGECRHRLLVVAGTVFSHILLWNASAAATSDAGPNVAAAISITATATRSTVRSQARPTLHRLTGHEGVIFNVQINAAASQVCSVSDDRSVRVWRWTATQTAAAVAASSASIDTPLPWSTLIDPARGSFISAAPSFGHRARVWRCLQPASWPLVLSASEDSSCAVWHSATGELLHRFSGQKGGIWSLALHEASGVLALGAGDGSVRMVSVKPLLRRVGLIAGEASDIGRESRTLTLRVSDLFPNAAVPAMNEATIAAASSSPAAAVVASAVDSSASHPSKKAKLNPSASALATEEASVATASSSAKPKRPPPPKKLPAGEFCRELLLDVHHRASDSELESQSSSSSAPLANLYCLTSTGRVLKVAVHSATSAASISSSALALSPDLLAPAELLHMHTASSAPLVALALSPCKSLLAVGDQRGNMILVPTRTDQGLHAAWIPGAHQSACGFLQWLPWSCAPASSDVSAAVGTLLTGDAVHEVKLWSVQRRGSSFELVMLSAFKLPVKARVSSAMLLPLNDLWRGPDVAEDESDDEEAAMVDSVAETASSDANEQVLLLGDSRGSVYVYLLTANGTVDHASGTINVVAVSRVTDAHDKSAVSSFAVAPVSSLQEQDTRAPLTLFSTGRNGSVVEFTLDIADETRPSEAWAAEHNSTQQLPAAVLARASSIALSRRRVHKLSSLSSAEQLLWSRASSSSSRDMLVLGFHAMDLILWNVSQNTEVRRWNCGGDKRSWAFKSLAASEGSDGGEQGFVLCYTQHGEENKGDGAAAASTSASTLSGGAGQIVLHVQIPPAASQPSGGASFVPSLCTSIHARLTTSLEVLPWAARNDVSVLVTGSEDNSVKVFAVHHGDSAANAARNDASSFSTLATHAPITCLATIVDHADVVRTLAYSQESSGVHLLFSGGGRDYLHCTRIGLPHAEASAASAAVATTSMPPIRVSVESLGGVSGGGCDRRSTAPSKTWIKRPSVSPDAPESDGSSEQLDLRIMCLTAFPVPVAWIPAAKRASSSWHVVATGNSAGRVKFFLFDAARRRFNLVAQSGAEAPESEFAQLSMAHVQLRIGATSSENAEKADAEVLVVTGCTSGVVRVWALRDIMRGALNAMVSGAVSLPAVIYPLASFPQHQSGINCLHAACVVVSPSEASATAPTFVVLSGGDDQAIAMCGATLLASSSESTASLQHTWTTSLPNAHVSAVKSLALDGCSARVYSVGYDQRVRVWSVELSASSVSNGPASSPSLVLRPVSKCDADVWDVTSVRLLQQSPSALLRVPPTASTSPDADSSSSPAACPLLAIAGQGLQVMQLVDSSAAGSLA